MSALCKGTEKRYLCKDIKKFFMETGYWLDEVFGERLLISESADKSELQSNIRAARAILASYQELYIGSSAKPRVFTSPHKVQCLSIDFSKSEQIF